MFSSQTTSVTFPFHLNDLQPTQLVFDSFSLWLILSNFITTGYLHVLSTGIASENSCSLIDVYFYIY